MKRRYSSRQEVLASLERIPSMPEELKEEVRSWEYVVRSPYSTSFYSTQEKRWSVTPEGCYRVSNHWNYQTSRQKAGDKVSCPTDVAVSNGSTWTLAQFEQGLWRVKKSLRISG